VGFLHVVWSQTLDLSGQIRGGLGFSYCLLQLQWSEGKLDKEATVSENKVVSSAKLSLRKQASFPSPVGRCGGRRSSSVLGDPVVLWPVEEARGEGETHTAVAQHQKSGINSFSTVQGGGGRGFFILQQGRSFFFSWEFIHAGGKLAGVFDGRMVTTPSFGFALGYLRRCLQVFFNLLALMPTWRLHDDSAVGSLLTPKWWCPR
jgi:hypothetical protein